MWNYGMNVGLKAVSSNFCFSHYLHNEAISSQLLSCFIFQFSLDTQSCLTVCNLMDHIGQGSLFITNSWSPPILMLTESVMPLNHLILCHHLLFPPSLFPSIRGFSNVSNLCISWRKYCSFIFNISLPRTDLL